MTQIELYLKRLLECRFLPPFPTIGTVSGKVTVDFEFLMFDFGLLFTTTICLTSLLVFMVYSST
jgi:hypothetical protein